jgi:arsenate reductase
MLDGNVASSSFMKCPPHGLKNENDFKENDLGKDIENDKKMFEAMEAYPKIIERPIVTSGSKAVIGRPPENILKLM